MRNFIAFILVFGIHSAAQFLAWAYADAPGRNHDFGAWKTLSFPTFTALGRFANAWFWPSMIANSGLWALFGVVFLAWLGSPRQQTGE